MGKELNIVVPAGIGDVSWVLSKLETVKDKYDFNFYVCEGWPHRTVEFLELFPWIKKAEYAPYTYTDIIQFQTTHKLDTFKAVEECGFGRILLAPNLHLERGLRLENWLPDLSTNFHYEIPHNEENAIRAAKILKGWNKIYPVYGISAASYRGAEAWKTWKFDEWQRFLRLWIGKQPDIKFVLMGGSWDDLTASLYDEFESYCIDAVGRTSFGVAIEIHRKLTGYVGFSSGLGIIRTVLGLKTFMLWPDFQCELSTSWAPPEMLEDRTYTASLWRDPVEVFHRFNIWRKL